MEQNILTTVLITILSVGALSTLVYLILAVRNLKSRVDTLAFEMVDFHTEYDRYQIDQQRELADAAKDIDIRLDRVHRKMNKQEEEQYRELQKQVELLQNNLPNEIRKTIQHIEFARPLDNTFKNK
jgi:hypothetical protein